MEALQRLGIHYPLDAHKPGPDAIKFTSIDPADSHDFFARLLVPVIKTESGDLLDEDDGILARFSKMCQAYAKRSSLAMRHNWELEAEFWSLLRVTLPPITSAPLTDKGAISPLGAVQNFLESKAEFVHLLRIKEWLEKEAGPFLPSETRKAPVPLTHSPTCPLDPDAFIPDRLEIDSSWEEANLATLWQYLRRGRLQEAIAWCFEVEQPWRAAIISGGFLHSDPVLDGKSVNDLSGNPDRATWKASVKRLIESSSVSLTEKAVYGSLIGDLDSILPLCSDWKDILWAAVITTLEMYVHHFLAGHWKETSEVTAYLKSAFSHIEAKFVELKSDPVFFLVKSLIFKGKFYKAAFDNISGASDDFLRLAATASILIFNFTQQQEDIQYFDISLHAYLRFLLESNQVKNLIFFCSQLKSSELASDSMLEFLEAISARSKDVKWIYLNEARLHGISIDNPMKKLARARLDLAVQDLLLFDDASLKPILVEYSSQLLRNLLLNDQIAVAKKVMADLPLHQISELVDSPTTGSFAKELFYYNHLLQALATYEDWSAAYALALNGEEIARFIRLSTVLGTLICELLSSDWLGDVEEQASVIGLDSDRENELAAIRAKFIADLVVLLISMINLDPSPQLGEELLTRFSAILSDTQLELWLELRRAGQLDLVIEKLGKMARLSKIQTFASALVFLQDNLQSSR